MSYGFLTSKPLLREHWPYQRKVFDPLERAVLTRHEEYAFGTEAARASGPGFVLDAGCGWVDGLHIQSHLIADELTYPTIALDSNPEHLTMQEPHPKIIRMVGNLWALPFGEQQFQTTLCISTLEHVPGMYRALSLAHLCRVTLGTLIITADGMDVELLADAVTAYNFDPGERLDEGEPLLNDKGEPVCYLKANRIGGWAIHGQKILKKVEDGTTMAATTTPSTGCTRSSAF